MIMTTLTRNSSRREQRLQELMLDRLVAKYERRISREISRAMFVSATLYSRGNTMAADAILADHKERLEKILNSLWLESGDVFSEHLVGALKSQRPKELKVSVRTSVGEIPPTEIANAVMLQWIRSIGVEKLVQITTTTQNDIRNAIATGIQDGLGEKGTAKLIRAIAPSISASRSQTIARTETHNAANEAAQATAEATGIDMRRQWVASQDERTRTTHSAANGQIVGMHEPFIVGGVELRFPGDATANSPKETINCRCAVIFVV